MDAVQDVKDLIEVAKTVCSELGVSVPTVKTSRRRAGCYWVLTQTINLGQQNLKNPAMLKQVFVHELTHHIDHQVNKADWDQLRFGKRIRSSHDRAFYRTLLIVVDKFYGNRSEYPWRWEYRTISKWAKYAGIHNQTKEYKREAAAWQQPMGPVQANDLVNRVVRLAAERAEIRCAS